MRKLHILLFIIILIIFNMSSYSMTKIFYISPISGLNMREEPNLNSKVVLLIPYKIKIKVLNFENPGWEMIILNGRPGKWVKTIYENKIGYVFDGFLSEVEPDDSKPLVGEYIMQVDLKKSIPSQLFLYSNNTFKYYVNLCSNFGTAFGNYSVDNKIIRLEVKRKDYNIDDKEKFELLFKIENGNLRLIKAIPYSLYGCDATENDIFIKK